MRILTIIALMILLAACRATKPIQSVIAKKDTSVKVTVNPKTDSVRFIENTWQQIHANYINFKTFTAKVNVDYSGSDGKKYDVNANIRMLKDSAIWISANAVLGIEAIRMLVTKDSVKLLDKLNKTYTARSVDYLQEVTSLPLNLSILQDLLIGNPVFFDSNIVSYSQSAAVISLLSLGQHFKNLITIDAGNKYLQGSKLDDADLTRNRTADLVYSDYEEKQNLHFATRRRITISEKKKLDIKLDFKQYDFGAAVSFPFSIPKNYLHN